MAQVGVTELIWHFAGYMHLADELARARTQFEEGDFKVSTQEFEDRNYSDKFKPEDLDQWDTGRILPYVAPVEEAMQFAKALPDHIRHVSDDYPQRIEFDPDLAKIKFSGAVFGGSGSGSNVYRYEGGDEKFIDTNQLNWMNDNDMVGVDPDSGVMGLNNFDVKATLGWMTDAAGDAITDGVLPQGSYGLEMQQSMVEQQMARAESGEAPSHVDYGIYINGVKQEVGEEEVVEEEGDGEEDALREGAPPAMPDQPDGWLPGDPTLQAAETGGNEAYNGASIIDANEACGTLVVLGNYYMTNAIFQTNVYTDQDCVTIGGNGAGAGYNALVETGGNIAENTAQFEKTALLEEIMDNRGLTGFNWNIEISYGDHFDIKTLTQTNYISGNDIVCQTQSGAFYRVSMDANGQANIVTVEDYGKSYDLIVVLGNYHGGNYICQNNFILDNDKIMMSAPGEDGVAQSVYAGQNYLSNTAVISSYGLEGFMEISDDFEAFIRDLETTNNISPQDWWAFSGSGSATMNVLFVTGDYYDMNYICQNNYIVDYDTALQMFGEYGADGQQFLSTGGNTAENAAIIVDVGAYGDQYVGGEVYEESFLVQTEIAEGNNDTIVYGNADQLANEVVAFAYTPEEVEEQQELGIANTQTGGDELGHIMT
ncbi:hypothetical protein H2509_02445 [Stappia sp. F7233]|uniref:Uncharacterized protein n=1 Tax=Stappia albiluteola TaxID=2758565 RepID=A0A839A8X8_9HYPH|nr:hypothetical protein [Stappia albiluteola]MBA5775983.1 hypothetical protein [Stappia albiluteola]